MHAPKFEIYEDAAGYWRWRLRAANGEILAQSESYTGGKTAAEAGAEAARRSAAVAAVVIITKG